MGSVKITVFGRIKPCNKLSQEYKIKCGEEEDQITFINARASSTPKRSFRFRKIFGEDATQEEIFEAVGKPVIQNIFSGYNGTIFTYGQTGSGKTYTMTGEIEEWDNQGLIPRIIEEIFKLKGDEMTVSLTYCEIYNEHIYDLLRTDKSDSELPPISLVDMNSGISNFRNLSTHPVKTMEEAMQLFTKGDANKMVAETGSNVRSSRSHVILSLALEFPHPNHENLRLKPILNLVDLAGSEKLSKCKTPISNVNETRYINLSLHYLEQVLIALRQPGRAHVPYRNSLMTALLKNSFGGNCITIMIATFSVSKEDSEETGQTCRFAERIALIKNEVKLSELISPEKEIEFLKKENERLKAQLKLIADEQVINQLDDKDKEKCTEAVQNFIQDNDYFELPLTNVRRMEYCFRIMRDEILRKREFTDCDDIKVKESQLEFLRTIKGIKKAYSQQKLANRQGVPGTSTLNKNKSVEIPKVNIIYSEWDIKEKEKYIPKTTSKTKLKAKKVNSFDAATQSGHRDVNTESFTDRISRLNFENKGLKKISRATKYKDELCYLLKENESRIQPVQTFSFFKPQNPCEDNMKNKNFNNNYPLKVYKSSTSSSAALLFDLSKEEFPKTPENEREYLEKKMNSDTELKNLVESKSDNIFDVDLRSSTSINFESFTAKCVPLTGDKEVDEEILNFYQSRYHLLKDK